jgi:hypothetical protein
MGVMVLRGGGFECCFVGGDDFCWREVMGEVCIKNIKYF